MDEKKKKGFKFGVFGELLFKSTDYTKKGKPRARSTSIGKSAKR